MDRQHGLELYEKAQRLAATDEVFRKEILANPVAALEKLSGEKFPTGTKIMVVEEDSSYDSTIVIPRFVGAEIDESELENVAGGSVVFISGPCLVTAILIA